MYKKKNKINPKNGKKKKKASRTKRNVASTSSEHITEPTLSPESTEMSISPELKSITKPITTSTLQIPQSSTSTTQRPSRLTSIHETSAVASTHHSYGTNPCDSDHDEYDGKYGTNNISKTTINVCI